MAVIDLGSQPACDDFGLADTSPDDDGRWPLGLNWCRDCALVQLTHSSPGPEVPLATTSRTALLHADAVAGRLAVRAGLDSGASVTEFASAHGGHWNAALNAAGFVTSEGPADLVVDNHGLIHDEDLDEAVAVRVAALAPGGVLAIEFHHVLAQVEQSQIDTIRHGHPIYLSLTSWSNACERHGLVIVDVWEEAVYGGCLMVLARRSDEFTTPTTDPAVGAMIQREVDAALDRPEGYVRLANTAAHLTDAVQRHLAGAAAQGRRVVGYGAGSKAVTFLGVTSIDAAHLPVVADASPAKWGRRIPASAIQIVSPAEALATAPHEVFVLTWDIASEVTEQLRAAGFGGDVVVAIPEVRVFSAGGS